MLETAKSCPCCLVSKCHQWWHCECDDSSHSCQTHGYLNENSKSIRRSAHIITGASHRKGTKQDYFKRKSRDRKEETASAVDLFCWKEHERIDVSTDIGHDYFLLLSQSSLSSLGDLKTTWTAMMVHRNKWPSLEIRVLTTRTDRVTMPLMSYHVSNTTTSGSET